MIGLTAVGFPLAAAVIDILCRQTDLVSAWAAAPANLPGTGLALLITPGLAWSLHRIMRAFPFFHDIGKINRSLVRTLKPSLWQIVGISVAAGWGEEIFFRGAVQPVLGIVTTSVIFAGLHTGFRFRVPALRKYFALVFILSLGLGMTAQAAGLVTAMVAHAGWDLVMLSIVYREVAALPDGADAPGGNGGEDECGGDQQSAVIEHGGDTVAE
ncbi:CPBP family intramembrane metalloprotease [bacterium]|nr:CPBP family intramembrane metalloprotease [candidate division CSSED10-310 bacterium]